MKKLMTILLGLWSFSSFGEVTVTNLLVMQRPGTKLVDISYDVSSTETNVVWVKLSVCNGTQAVSVSSVSGDVGEGVATGAGKTILWDSGADWDGSASSNMVFELIMGVGVLPEDMVRVPAGTNPSFA